MEIKINYTRPEKIKQYKKQLQFIDSPHRFTFVEATSKAGKTVGCITWIFEQAISPYGWFWPNEDGTLTTNTGSQDEKITDKSGYNYWWVAPTYPVAKIAYRRLKRYISDKRLYQCNESELTITLANGAMIFFKGADKPDTLYGEDVYALVCDEASRTKKEAYTAIYSTLTATNGLMKAIGNVKGINNWFYKEAQKTKKEMLTNANGNAAYYLITAADAVRAGVLEQKVIDDAEKRLPYATFQELYYGIPNTAAANQYCFSFDAGKHVKSCTVNYNIPLWLSFDFNINPISCTVIQYHNGLIRVPYVLQLANSNIFELCKLIKAKFPNAMFMVTGDATGKNTNALARDSLNYFRAIKAELKLPMGRMQQLKSNPPTDENQVLVNAVLEKIPHEIDPDGAGQLIKDMQQAAVDDRGKLLKKNRDNEAEQLEALDGYRYWVNYQFRDWLKKNRHL